MCLKTLLGRENYQYFDKVLIHLARQLVACRWKNCTVHRAFHFVPHVVDKDHSWEQLSLLYFCKIELFPETDVYIIKGMIINAIKGTTINAPAGELSDERIYL